MDVIIQERNKKKKKKKNTRRKRGLLQGRKGRLRETRMQGSVGRANGRVDLSV